LRCYLNTTEKVKVEYRQFFPLHTTFLDREILYNYLKEGLKDVDIAFIGIGTWYLNANNDDISSVSSSSLHSLKKIPVYDRTAHLLDHCEPSKINLKKVLFQPPPADATVEVNNCMKLEPPFTYQYSYRRRNCGEFLLSNSAFSSDMKLLHDVLLFDRRTARLLPPIIWKDIPPQHFPFASSGKWKDGQWNNDIIVSKDSLASMAMMNESSHPAHHLDENYTCIPIGSEKTAYNLNAIANQYVTNGKSSSSRAGSSSSSTSGFAGVARSWDLDMKSWYSHPKGDCTHYCSTSEAAAKWGEVIAHAMAESPYLKDALRRRKQRDVALSV
jgi:hypothetical protein